MSGEKFIRDWLGKLGLADHAETFERERIDVEALHHLTAEDLKDLGLPMGHRVKLLAAIRALPEASGQTPSAQQASSPHTYTPRHLAEKILTSRSALEGERKQVTVLFCDIANSTQLAEQAGAEAMHGILSRFFELSLDRVHRYEGTVNQFLGDGFMALFGAPVAHEDDARRGVLAALGIRRALAEPNALPGLPAGAALSVRIGLHTGPVVVGSIGDNLRMDYTAIGDTTNLAARLEQHAQPGEILVSELTARLVKGYANVEALPPLAVKGKVEPIRTFRVTAPGHRRSRLEQERTLSPFVGREREITALREALEEVLTGRGQVVGIVGEPGVGKSRVLYEFRRLLAERDVAYLEGWCQSYGQSIPYLPLQDVVRAVCGIEDSDTPAQVAKRMEAVLGRLGLSPQDDAPYLLRLLGVDEGSETLIGLTPEAIQAHTFDALARVLLAQARERPLVLGIEDLHWIDKSSEAFFVHLVEGLAGAPFLLLTTSRPGYSPPWIAKSYTTQLALRVLSPEASRRIIEATVARSELEDATTEAILRKAEGNPLFLEELTLALEGHSALAAAQPLPDTIQGVLAARIDRLPEESKRTLQTASVLGREFSLRLLEEISLDKAHLDPQLGALKQLEFLYERTAAEGPAYTFKHVLTQEVAYESLLSARRQALHEAAGRALERFYPERIEEHCEVLAHHFSRSANKEKALDYLELANRKAIKSNAVLDAKAYFEEALRAFDVLPDTPEYRRRRIALLIPQVHVFILADRLDQYERHLEACAAIAETLTDDGLRGHFQACRGHCHFMLGRPQEAIASLAPAAALCERAGNFEGAGHALAHLQWTHLQRGDFEDVLKYEAPALRALDRAPNRRLRVYALSAASWACSSMGRWDLAVEKAQAALGEGEAGSDISLVCFAQWVLSIAYTQKESVAPAVEWARRSYENAPTPGDRGWAQMCYGEALALHAPESAIELLEPIAEVYRSGASAWTEAWAAVGLGDAYLRAGRLEEARRVLVRAIEVAQPRAMYIFVGPAQRLLGEVLLASGRDEALGESEEWFERAIEMFKHSKAENQLALAYAGCGRLKARQGKAAQAREYFGMSLAIFERLGTLNQPERVRAALADLAQP